MVLTLLVGMLAPIAATASSKSVSLKFLGRYQAGFFAEGAAEIAGYDEDTERLFVTNGAQQTIDVLDVSNPSQPTLFRQISIAPYGANANSVAVRDGIVAAAVENVNKQAPGSVVFFDADGDFLSRVTVGALPDMVTFTPDGEKVLVANEGEPNDDYTDDPEGSVSIIDVSDDVDELTDDDVVTADFRAFNGATLDPSIRIFGPNATVAQDLEPEFIAVSPNSRWAWVTLQENNALALVDLDEGKVKKLMGLGFKDHSAAGNELDASNRDGAINIARWPVRGMYQPDAIATFRANRRTYLITTNEGDAREYLGTPGFVGETRVGDVVLDPTSFPDAATLQEEGNLGRLKVTHTMGDTDGDGDFDELFSYGARSFSIWTTRGELVFDSGSDLERITAAALPNDFNSEDEANGTFDERSDDKGPEPEGVVTARLYRRTYAFIGLERVGGVVVYDVTNPHSPSFVQYVNTRNFDVPANEPEAGDLSPEGLLVIPAKDSPNDKPLLVVTHEISGTTTIFEIGHSRKK